MASSLKVLNHSFITRVGFKNKITPRIFLSSRKYCTKDNNTNEENDHSKGNLSEVDTTELPKESSKKLKVIRGGKPEFSDETKAAAKQKLMSLLSEITMSSSSPSQKTTAVNLARPLKREYKKQRLEAMKEQQMTPEKEMDMAVKAVASSFKEDSEIIKSELSEKLNSLKMSKELSTEEAVNIDESEIDNEINENLMSSVKGVAAAISENPIPPRSELTQRLLRMSLEHKDLRENKKSMMSVIETMKLESHKPAIERKKAPRPQQIVPINLFGSAPLNIFKLESETKADTGNLFWQKLQQKHLRLLTQFAPANGFEEMIMWTEQGKHWKFPIDNETEMGAEEEIGFNEHVFLEQHLQGFPTKGPIRHFMELVTVGLSKNPYITVERKIENIEWFRNYFKEKEDILKETGALV